MNHDVNHDAAFGRDTTAAARPTRLVHVAMVSIVSRRRRVVSPAQPASWFMSWFTNWRQQHD